MEKCVPVGLAILIEKRWLVQDRKERMEELEIDRDALVQHFFGW